MTFIFSEKKNSKKFRLDKKDLDYKQREQNGNKKLWLQLKHYLYFRESTLEITKGIREYFNNTLGLQLLYKWERPQFIQIMNDNPEALPSQLYGAFHLLRLFGKTFYNMFVVFNWHYLNDNFNFVVRLGGMLSYTPLDEKSIQLLLSHFHDFLQYLQKNNAVLFNLQQDYTDPSPDYHRKYG